MSDEKSGYVYFLAVKGKNSVDIMKVGMTKTLPVETSNPNSNCRFKNWVIFPPEVVDVNLIGYARTNDRKEAEKKFHNALKRFRIPYQKEFFTINKTHIMGVLNTNSQWLKELEVFVDWVGDSLYYDYVFQCFRPKMHNEVKLKQVS